ncbi:hypothetical protein [Chitinophaga arvensicola]|uniref:ATP-binding protein n=1 Tax=Chitinophaga arvensicola TaxID=29529 RepID=A0A1I0PHQ0_9BACT|nr:hypothetical protein [Chitinophaga arvensicola]SEW13944.1 hypothetical protein SAMN04488122_0792 [Chitinophaga arvensicola]
MKMLFPVLAILFAPCVLHAQKTISGLASPESAVAYKDGYFVSNIGVNLDAMAKDGDGSISYINSKGKLETLKYFDDVLHAPKGLDIIGNVIYVADIDHVKGYNIASRKKVFDLNLEGGKAALLNDVTGINDSLLVVTDSFKDHALLVNVQTGTYTELKGNMVVPNGVVYNAKTDEIFVCSMGANLDGTGKIFSKKLHDQNAAFTPLENTPTGVLDGIVLIDDHRLLVSDWIVIKEPTKGNLYVYDLDKKQYKKIEVERAPADIAIDVKQRTLLIPQLLDNRLKIVPLKEYGL